MAEKPAPTGPTNPRVADKTAGAGAAAAPAKATQYGKHATMPVLAADQYAQVILPDLTEFDPENIKLYKTLDPLRASTQDPF